MSKPDRRGHCSICNEPVHTWETAAFPITGWEVERYGGGANQIKGRQRKEFTIAHATCVDRKLNQQRRGHIEGQLSWEG